MSTSGERYQSVTTSCVSARTGTPSAREPEVRDLQHVVRVHQQVLRLQVAMNQAAQVAVVEPLEELVH